MDKKIVETSQAPKAIGPYSQAIVSGGFLFSAGQIPLDPATMKLVEGDVKVQAQRVLENLKAVLEAENLDFSKVIKTTIYLKDLNDFQAVNEIYSKYFGSFKPARSTVQVAKLPLDSLIEVDLIARVV
ncbi:MAG: endoribonuclease [bacterium]|nr:MAG: endoribonuclease [bacterium]